MAKSTLLTCEKCGWVYFGVTPQYASGEVRRFNNFFNKLTLQQRFDFYGNKSSSYDQYTKCYRCGNHYKNFRISTKKEQIMAYGHTINPIIYTKKRKK